MTSTYEHAQRVNAGKIFTDGKGNRAIYSDRSDGTKQAFGWLIWADGTKGTYQELPDNLHPERYNVTEAHEFAQRIKALGFVVYMAAGGHYGVISDDTGERVLSFSFPGVEDTLSGNYGPPSRESGTGWRMDQDPQSLRTADDVREALNACPPAWCRRASDQSGGWKRFTTLAEHLAAYGQSSKYRQI
jgi:hypothetical protein